MEFIIFLATIVIIMGLIGITLELVSIYKHKNNIK